MCGAAIVGTVHVTGSAMLALRLPTCAASLPENFEAVPTPAQFAGAHTAAAIEQALQNCAALLPAPPQVIAGSDSTSVLWWLLAARQFPQARPWCYVQDEQRWLPVRDAVSAPLAKAAAVTTVTQPRPSPVAATPQEPAKPLGEMTRQPASPAHEVTQFSDGRLLSETFKLAAWGPTPERIRQLEALEAEALSGRRSAWVHQRLVGARRNGEKAHDLGQSLLTVFQQQGEAAARQWMEKNVADRHESIARHLQITLGKAVERQHTGRQRMAGAQAQQHKSHVHTALRQERHPNSLRHQVPHAHWNIFIDETGQRFDDSADDLPATDKDVGRMVALAVPASTRLPALKGFHGSDAPPADVDRVLQVLLDAPVGILGFSVQDHSARQSYWIGQVMHLVRWVLLQLPVPNDASSCQVRVFIEQKDNYTRDVSLQVLSDTLESEFRAFDPKRFGHLDLSLEFMDKHHPMNGYVDAIAFTWGSPASISKDRLKKSLLRGHCLVDAIEHSLHHLYLYVSGHSPLASADWYALCSAASSDPQEGFLARSLDSLGQAVARDDSAWLRYLAEVQRRLAGKQYRLHELAHAVAWLERYAPEGQALPKQPGLLLLSNRLALNNHQGHVDPALLENCVDLLTELRDEDPRQACETLLRVASATTNAFEFDVLRGPVNDWLALPVAVPGLLLHGKLHSTLGQIDAFTGRPAQAMESFDRALQTFARLSDPALRLRESQQTRSYRLVAQMDVWQADGAPVDGQQALKADLLVHLGNTQPDALSRSLAYSGQDRRFDQYLWLRALVCLPESLEDARQAYCSQQAQWQSGADHPWPLIDAYRAWLLHDMQLNDRAQEHLQWALESCTDARNGSTLIWMAEVLRTLAQAMGIAPPNQAPSAASRTSLRTLLPHAPHLALEFFASEAATVPISRTRLLEHLAACLPFTFH